MEQLERARQEVLAYLEENLNRLSRDQGKVVKEIIAYLTVKNYVIDKKLIKMVHEIIEENYRFIKTFLENLTLEKLPLPREVDNNAFRQKLLDRLFNFLYPDGLNLSERLWKRKEETKKEFLQVIRQQIHLRKSAVQTAYAIQYHMERKLGKRFANTNTEKDFAQCHSEAALQPKNLQKVIKEILRFAQNDLKEFLKQYWYKLTKEEIKLIEKLRRNAKAMIKGEISKKKWDSILKQYERYIKQRKETGVLYAHKTLLRELTKAVEEASTKAVDEAVHWYMYDKQLYNLKRIARTETARILNTAVVEAYKDNPFCIGFRWILNPAHKITDICDKYANADFGLGKGVFPKGKEPECPAHPNCGCKLFPVFR
ncbi:MAG: hypothetical protein DSY34_00775 [Desulfurobacterium sp.]|nr:MAG: hypothetical protein DSY34_00775 [Desulfurobacterium sp.]